MQNPLIFDVKRYAINDGPGIRVTIFLKGCNLNCTWCHNPESISPAVQKMYNKDKCIGCGTCVEACPTNAITLTPNGIVTDTELCNLCGKCAEVCPTEATQMSGRETSIDEIMNIIEKERTFFDQSGGGVTFSGGEPLMHSSFLIKLLDACGERGIHRVVDTAGLAKTETLLEVAKRTELFLFDLKLIDSIRHKKWTSVSNNKILENLKILAESGAQIIIRIPLIGGVNDDDENIKGTARFISELAGNKKHINLLPYHNIAQKKYEKLGRINSNDKMIEPTQPRQQEIIKLFAQYGLTAEIGG
ncbi:MAG: glycyl-radical enzyme activating protein [Ignavibacteriae bacterium]|nr:glycyl-radical enzyme activating protein [Ignavibacteriota bacterium]NOG99164.1 glycyl-radical enzyme activating protein [Ignavibacteriota bacterium]